MQALEDNDYATPTIGVIRILACRITIVKYQYIIMSYIEYWKPDNAANPMLQWDQGILKERGNIMGAPSGFKTIEEIAVENKVPLSRVQTAINTLNIPQQSFPPDRRRRYYAPEDVEKIKEWLKSRQ